MEYHALDPGEHVTKLAPLLGLLLFACDEEPAPAPRPPACLFLDASVPAPAANARSTDPAVFTGEECRLLEPACVWACTHDGVHIVTHRSLTDCTHDNSARPFMRVTADGGLEVIGR